MDIESVKVFHVCTDFIVVTDEESAKKFYVEMVGPDDVSVEEMEIEEIPRERWPTMKIVEIDEPGHPTHTFQESIEEMLSWNNQDYPKVLASSEY